MHPMELGQASQSFTPSSTYLAVTWHRRWVNFGVFYDRTACCCWLSTSARILFIWTSGGVRKSALTFSFSVLRRWQDTFVPQGSRLRRLSSGSRIQTLSTRAEGATFSPDLQAERRKVPPNKSP